MRFRQGDYPLAQHLLVRIAKRSVPGCSRVTTLAIRKATWHSSCGWEAWPRPKGNPQRRGALPERRGEQALKTVDRSLEVFPDQLEYERLQDRLQAVLESAACRPPGPMGPG